MQMSLLLTGLLVWSIQLDMQLWAEKYFGVLRTVDLEMGRLQGFLRPDCVALSIYF
jgi:hypothetical protein